MEPEELGTAKHIDQFQELLDANQDIEGEIEILDSISDEEMEDERVSKELDLLLEAEPDSGEEYSKFISESESQMSQDEQMGSRKEREHHALPGMSTVSDKSQTLAPSIIVDEKA